jgi:hypothetical protein
MAEWGERWSSNTLNDADAPPCERCDRKACCYFWKGGSSQSPDGKPVGGDCKETLDGKPARYRCERHVPPHRVDELGWLITDADMESHEYPLERPVQV